jgi:hypothetical protein
LKWLVPPPVKLCLLALTLGLGAAPFRLAAEPPPSPAAEKEYRAFIAQLLTPENVADCIARMDAIIDEQEKTSAGNTQPAPAVGGDTKLGLHMEYTVMRTPEASMYYFVFSRNGQDLRYDDATRMIALFCDRVGLPHPVTVREGEKPVFTAQWLIKPSEWKAMSKMIQKTRVQNRAEKDPQQALKSAIMRELAARQTAR